ncbi:MAG: C2H2-type zinc finger protein [Thermoplasmata archaeon]
MDEIERPESTEQPTAESIPCPDCGQSFKTAQGLAGHRRLAHSASSARELDERTRELDEHRRALESKSAEIALREEAARRKGAEAARRQREIESVGPSSIGLDQCEGCGAWFDDSNKLLVHTREVHPLDEAVAAEARVSTSRVNDVWTEACNKQKRHPDKTSKEIVKRFWSGTDQKILRSLLDHNAAFKFEGED